MDISQLIEQCRQGNEQALSQLYSTYANKMKGVCRRYFADSATVDDILHDAFVVIFTTLDSLRDTSKAEAWMMSIVRNIASKAKLQYKATPFVSLEDAASIIDDNDSEPVDIPNVTKLIDQLPEGYGKVFRLSVFEGMTHKQIAAELGIEPHSSSSQLSRAKAMLRSILRKSLILLLLLLTTTTPRQLRHQRQQFTITPTSPAHNDTTSIEGVVVANNNPPSKIAIIHDTLPDTSSNIVIQTPDLSDTLIQIVTTDTTAAEHDADIVKLDTTTWQPDNIVPQPKRHGKWSVKLSYSGAFDKTSHYNQPYIFEPASSVASDIQSTPVVGPIISPVAPTTPSIIDNWNDYAIYLSNHPELVSSKASRAIARIALNNAAQPGNDKMLRTSIHRMPASWTLTLKYKSDKRLGFETGLGFTNMISDFEIGADGNIIKERQSISYIGLPIKGIYTVCEKRRLNLYFELNITTEIPSSASLRSDYYISGVYETSDKTTIKAPWQWAAGCGFGLQYNITPEIGLFAEPSLQYYFPLSGIETYRTEHPKMFVVPVGLKFSW